MTDYAEMTVSQEIDGITYTSTKFGAMKQASLLGRLASVLGEGGLAMVASSGLKFSEGLGDRIFKIIENVAMGIRDDEKLLHDLCANLKCNKLRPAGEGSLGSLAVFDAHFSGELPHLFHVLSFVVMHNYMGFSLGSR